MARIGQSLSPEELYLRLRQVVEEMPDLKAERISSELSRWFGEASFLVEELGYVPDAAQLRTEIESFGTMLSRGYDTIPIILHRSLKRAEARAPSSARGTFIAAGQPFDALATVSKLFSGAGQDVLIVDAYAEAKLLDAFLRAVPDRVPIRVLTATPPKPTLKPAVNAWGEQFGADRPLEARKAPKGSLHDRLIMIDSREVWLLGQSFNALATRSNTYLSKADPELAKMKVEAYEQIWGASAPLT